jgi:transcriptional regulator of acetoin/glycerol metabolism
MNEDRFYLSLLGEAYENKGLRLNDKLILTPGIGKKREIKLNRKSYHFSAPEKDLLEVSQGIIKLPKVVNNDFEFEMTLTKASLENDSENRLRYLLKSKSNTPFRINGSLSYESFIERGDVITMGYNKLKFLYDFENDEKPIDICHLDKKLVESDLNILIEGETGTGKSTLAKKIHETSLRMGRFIQLNLSTFSPSLVESELFGHKKGAFTGAVKDRPGALELAHRGTLFIDEIDSLSLELQVKLLLFLDNSLVRKVGATQETKVDVRLIVASGSSLKEILKKEKMRKDFYFRISSGIKISLKPLRENKALLNSIIQNFSNKADVYFEDKLIQFYLNLPWPGNVRQLLGHLEKKKVLSNGFKIRFDEFDEELGNDVHEFETAVEDVISLKRLKTEYAQRILIKFNGNIKLAAEVIGITPKTMKKLAVNQL